MDASRLTGCVATLAEACKVTALLERLNGAQGCLLMFHRAVAAENWARLPNREFHLDAAFLTRMLDRLREDGWDIVSMSEAVSRGKEGRGSRFVNVSVDDVYRDSYETIVPVFRQAGVPVTLFVTTGIPDGTMELWEAGLETILLERDTVLLPDGAGSTPLNLRNATHRRQVFSILRSKWEHIGAEPVYHQFCALNGYDPAALRMRHAIDWDMLANLSRDPCAEIGAHTVNHPHLASLTTSRAIEEIAGCRQRLEAKLGITVQHFAFPFGRAGDCGPREARLAQEAGFHSAATTRRGLLPRGRAFDPFTLPRNTINGSHRRTSQMHFHLSGLSGLSSRLLRRV